MTSATARAGDTVRAAKGARCSRYGVPAGINEIVTVSRELGLVLGTLKIADARYEGSGIDWLVVLFPSAGVVRIDPGWLSLTQR